MSPKKSRFQKKFDPSTPISKVQEYLQEKARDGAICPCCKQWVQVQEKALTPDMGFVLMVLWKEFQKGPNPSHVTTILKELDKLGVKFSSVGWQGLALWKLIRLQPHPKAHGKSGYFRLTSSGEAFAKNESKVYSKIVLYEGKHLGFDTQSEQVSIIEVLGKDYYYPELVKGNFGGLP